MATIKDIAKVAGVSISTVSSVLNKKEGAIRVSDATREKVMAAAAELNYAPNVNARGLRSGKSFFIGVLVDDITQSFIPEAIQGIEEVLLRHGYSSVLCTYNSYNEFVGKCDFLRQKKVDGVIIFPNNEEEYKADYLKLSREMPAVTLGGSYSLPGVSYVRADGIEIARLGTEYLIKQNHQRIALLLGCCRERLDGYKRASEENGISFDESLVIDDCTTFDEGAAAFAKIIDLPNRPTAVLTQGDIVAAGVISAAHEVGVRVPEELSVVGVDDLQIARMIYPKLTTVAQPKTEHGSFAAENLLKMIANNDISGDYSVLLTPHIIERDSVKKK